MLGVRISKGKRGYLSMWISSEKELLIITAGDISYALEVQKSYSKFLLWKCFVFYMLGNLLYLITN